MSSLLGLFSSLLGACLFGLFRRSGGNLLLSFFDRSSTSLRNRMTTNTFFRVLFARITYTNGLFSDGVGLFGARLFGASLLCTGCLFQIIFDCNITCKRKILCIRSSFNDTKKNEILVLYLYAKLTICQPWYHWEFSKCMIQERQWRCLQ